MRTRLPATRLMDNATIGWLIESVGAPLLLFVYWVLVWRLERIDLLGNPPGFLVAFIDSLSVQPLLQRVAVTVMELFSWRVLRHFLPVAVALFLARRVVVGFVWSFYGLPDLAAAGSFLGSLRQTATEPAGGPSVTLKRDELAELKQQHSLLRVGGPGELKIGESDVVVTERNGRFYRVLGPGKQRLHKLEYVRTVLDLRQQERSQDQVSLVTQDGIELRVDVSVIFRLRLRDDDSAEIPRPTPDTPYPYGAAAVRQAAYAEMVLDNGQVTTWEDRPLRATIGALRQFVAETPLDMLIFPELTLAGGETRRPHETLRKTAQARADASLRKIGIQLLDVKLGRLETETQVTEQRIRYWQSYWDRQALLGAADGEASALREVALARAEAEAIMLRAIVEGLEDEDDQMRGDKTRQEVVALRLVGALERMATDEDTQILETDQILRRIQQLQQEIRRAPQLSRRPASEEQGET